MLEPTANKVFDPTPIKIPVALHDWAKKNNVKRPTKYALIYGGFLIEAGYTVVFEAKFDKLRVDIFTEEDRLISEVDGARYREQSMRDGQRDYFILKKCKFSWQTVKKINTVSVFYVHFNGGA